jgi:hypothetical protein
MGTPYLPETLRVHNILGLNLRVLQTFGLLLDDSLAVNRYRRVLGKAILFLLVPIHIYFIFGSVVQLVLSDEDSDIKLESITLTLSYVKQGIQFYVLIFYSKKFLDLIKSAEANFFTRGQPVSNTEMSITESYVHTARRLTGYIWINFALILSSVYIELIPAFVAAFERDATEFGGKVVGTRRTVFKIWTPFQKLDSPYLKLDIICELISVTMFFIVLTAINLLTLLLIIFFTGHFEILAESMEKVIMKTDHHARIGITTYS